MAIDATQFHQTFFEESLEGLEVMEATLLSLDPAMPDDEAINTIFRAAHSIKGGSATFGFRAIAEFTHVVETLLDEVRDGRRQIDQDLVDLLLHSADCLREMLRILQSGGEVDAACSADILQQLTEKLSGKEREASPVHTEAAAPVSASGGWHIRFQPHPHMLQTGNDPVRILRSLQELGEYRVKADTEGLPILAALDPESCFLSWEIDLQGEIPRSEIDGIFEWVEGDCELEISPMPAPAGTVAAAEAEPVVETEKREVKPSSPVHASAPAAQGTASIRVNIEKIDALINLLGEIVITQSMLNQLGDTLEIRGQTGREKLRDGLASLEGNTRELQEAVMRIRMLPISFAFQRFPRMVRDTSRQLGKQIELQLSGEQTELDKTVLEKIGDPLVHLIRNSLDHGIESPQARQAAGKPETGTVHLSACHQGGNIVIRIIDDGSGLDRAKIFAKAVERGLVAEGSELADEQIHDLIFQPGFSTADQVSDVSGRGVGMDVVRRNIESVGGTVEVSSEAGKGCTFTIRLPLTLAIMDGQLVRSRAETYIIPLVAISELLQIKPEQVRTIRGQAEVYRLREAYIPVVRLSEVFALPPADDADAMEMMIVVENGSEQVGLVVDEFLGQQQVVIKSLEQNFRQVEGISGATILGDGTVALILDIASLARLWRSAASGCPLPMPAINPSKPEEMNHVYGANA